MGVTGSSWAHGAGQASSGLLQGGPLPTMLWEAETWGSFSLEMTQVQDQTSEPGAPGHLCSAELGPPRYSQVPQSRHLPFPSEGQGGAQVGMGLAHSWSESSCEAQAKWVGPATYITYITRTTVASSQGSLCCPAVCLKLRAFPSQFRLRDGFLCSAVCPSLLDSGPQVLPGGFCPSPQVSGALEWGPDGACLNAPRDVGACGSPTSPECRRLTTSRGPAPQPWPVTSSNRGTDTCLGGSKASCKTPESAFLLRQWTPRLGLPCVCKVKWYPERKSLLI